MNSIFGSTLSLDGLLDDPLYNDVGEEEFLRDLGPVQPSSFGGLGFEKQATTQPCQTSSHNSSYSGVGYDASSDTAETFPSTASLPVASGLQLPQEWPVSAPMMQTTASYATCATTSQPQSQPQDNAALLTQLLTTIHASSQQQQALKQEPFNNLSIPEVLPQSGPAQPAVNVTLPSLTAEQQLALQSIMSLGSLGSTPEGKKVKRMLSNRESARRSRHRKQAHMQELEDRVHGIESENESLKLTLARFNEQDMRHKAEKMQLTAENAALRSRIMQLEQGAPCSPFSMMAADASRAGSFDSNCASGIKRSLPDAPSFEEASKRVWC